MEAIPDFDKEGGLIPAIAQDESTGEVLMLAWMNREAWDATVMSGRAVYWSRRRNRLWRKGESSGNEQIVAGIFLDCDRDAVILKVRQIGEAACHTGRRSCFFREIADGRERIISEPLFDPSDVYGNE